MSSSEGSVAASERLALAAILLLAAAIRLPNLGATDFWNDESYVALFAASDRPWAHLVAVEHSPPLYFLAVRAWTMLAGISEWTLRFPSALGGVAAVGAAWGLGRRLAGSRGGLLAALLVACSAHLAVQSREARAYILLVAPYLLAVLGATRLAESPSRRGWAELVLGGTIVCLLHYAAIPFVGLVALGALAFAADRRAILRCLILWILLGVLLYAPWISSMRRQLGPDSFFATVSRPGAAQGARDGIHFLARILAWTLGYNLPPSLFGPLYLPLAGAGGLLAAGGAFRSAGSRSAPARSARVAACAGLGGLLLAGGLYGAGFAREMVYLLFLEAAVLVLVACGLARMGRAGLAAAALLAALGFAGIREADANRFHLEDRLARAAWRDAADRIRAGIRPDEGVAVPNGWASSLGWYLRDAAIPILQWTRNEPYFRRAAPYLRTAPIPRDRFAAALTDGVNGVWWVEHRAELADPDGSLRKILDGRATDSEVVRAADPRLVHYRFR